MGRKKLPENLGRTAWLQLRVSPPFKSWVERYAESKGQTMTGLLLDLVVKAAKRDKFDPPPES